MRPADRLAKRRNRLSVYLHLKILTEFAFESELTGSNGSTNAPALLRHLLETHGPAGTAMTAIGIVEADMTAQLGSVSIHRHSLIHIYFQSAMRRVI